MRRHREWVSRASSAKTPPVWSRTRNSVVGERLATTGRFWPAPPGWKSKNDRLMVREWTDPGAKSASLPTLTTDVSGALAVRTPRLAPIATPKNPMSSPRPTPQPPFFTRPASHPNPRFPSAAPGPRMQPAEEDGASLDGARGLGARDGSRRLRWRTADLEVTGPATTTRNGPTFWSAAAGEASELVRPGLGDPDGSVGRDGHPTQGLPCLRRGRGRPQVGHGALAGHPEDAGRALGREPHPAVRPDHHRADAVGLRSDPEPRQLPGGRHPGDGPHLIGEPHTTVGPRLQVPKLRPVHRACEGAEVNR